MEGEIGAPQEFPENGYGVGALAGFYLSEAEVVGVIESTSRIEPEGGVHVGVSFPDIVRGIVGVVVKISQVIIIAAHEGVVFGLQAVGGAMDADLLEGIQGFGEQA